MRWVVSILVALILGALPGGAVELRGPKLAVASSFGQGVPPGLLDRALSLGIDDLRDELFWYRVEDRSGGFHYDEPMTVYPDQAGAGGATISLLVNNGHPKFDGGTTPLSPAAVRGFGRHAAAVVARFPAVTSVEVGNEFNSGDFVSGPLLKQPLAARAAAYVALLKSVYDQVKALRPEVRIIGGGVHSIPSGYLGQMLALGAAGYMDSIALHPYDTPIEQLARQIAVMRRLPGLEKMPVEITEFGSQDPAGAPDALLRGYCQMALSGVSRLAWYALNQRGDGYMPLIDSDLRQTEVMRSFLFLRETMEGRQVQDVAPDPFTYACLFDERVLVIWGVPRDLRLMSDQVQMRDATGQVLPGRDFRLSETAPLVLTSTGPIDLSRDFVLGAQEVIADSFHQFSFPDPAVPGGGTDPFRRFVRDPDGETPLATMPGQGGPGRPWTPWLGVSKNADVRVLSQVMLPAGFPSYPVEIVHEFRAPRAMRVRLDAQFDLVGESRDGISVVVRLNGEDLAKWVDTGLVAYRPPVLSLPAGARLEIALSPGATTEGDLTRYRITLRHAD
ncbi:hypothetical protein [Pseudooceanicola sp.]|uniref:hypothetical protein n=1 Tax=Pseudooceanicola sp. TaxID=1914328 RepID=UPI002635CEEB|nr:hypothetical protein [Pseudooceanicola sp.]MDF1856187.1 hypothetical protein [Pseudooceanicola sp.]